MSTEPKHETLEHEGFGLAGEVTASGFCIESKTRRYCAHCKTWVRTDGVLGELMFMGTHRDGDCSQ